MTRPTAVQLARDVLHRERHGDSNCPRCLGTWRSPPADATLARALLASKARK